MTTNVLPLYHVGSFYVVGFLVNVGVGQYAINFIAFLNSLEDIYHNVML